MDAGKDSLLRIRVSQEQSVSAYACENAEFFYLISGRMYMANAGQVTLLREGDFLVTPASQVHSFSAKDKVLYLIMQINGRAVRRYDIDPGQLQCTVKMSEEENVYNSKIRTLLGRLLGLYLSEAPEEKLLYNSVCSEFLYYLYKYYRLPLPQKPDEEAQRKSRIEAYIAQNYAYPIRLIDLAEHMYLSSVYLSRYFKKLFGMNFLEYLTAYRLSVAKEDLEKDTRRSITQIAYDNGFSNLNSFYAAFKADCGVSPAQWRMQKEAEAAASAEDTERAKEALSGYLKAKQSEDGSEGEQKDEKISCSVKLPGELYSKVWSRVVNVGEVRDLLRSDFQKHILMLHKELGFSHIRCWNLYADEFRMGIRRSREAHSDEYDFTILDRAFDFIVENGIKLYLDLGIKPYILLKGQRQFGERKKSVFETAEEQNWFVFGERKKKVFETAEEQNRFIRRFIRHYRRRYGADEIAGWYFEYWFDYEDPAEDAVQVYEREFLMISEIIKAEVPGAKIGGAGDDPGVLLRMPKVLACADFLSCYSYPDDEIGKDATADNRIVQREDYLDLQAAKLKNLQGAANGAKLHISEWSLSVSNRNMMNDSIFKAAYIVKNCINVMDSVDILAYWLGTDLYAEFTDTKKILFGGTGLLTRQSIYKPAWYAFGMLNRLGKYRLGRTENSIITKNSDTDIYILCHNYKRLSLTYYSRSEETLKAQDYQTFFEDRDEKTLTFNLMDLPCGTYRLSERIINDEYGNARKICAQSDEQSDLTLNDIRFMQRRCMPHIIYEQYEVKENNMMELKVSLEPDEVRLIHIRRT